MTTSLYLTRDEMLRGTDFTSDFSIGIIFRIKKSFAAIQSLVIMSPPPEHALQLWWVQSLSGRFIVYHVTGIGKFTCVCVLNPYFRHPSILDGLPAPTQPPGELLWIFIALDIGEYTAACRSELLLLFFMNTIKPKQMTDNLQTTF